MSDPTQSLVLVEDNMDDEFLSLRGISTSGVQCEVKVIRHGKEAVSLLVSPDGPNPDLIVLDFHLPGYNALEIVRELRKHEKTRHVPVVILSATESEQEVASILTEGANSFVQKASDPTIYAERVSMIVRYWLTVNKQPERQQSSNALEHQITLQEPGETSPTKEEPRRSAT